MGVKAVDVQLNRLAAGQYSLAHRDQALDLGMTARQIDERVASGLLVPEHRGVAESALEDTLMRRLVTFKLLSNTLERLGGPGRNGAGVLRALVEERDPATAPTQSMLEDLLFRVVRRGGLPAPVRQHEVVGVRLDGAYPHIRLGIEADSRTWHGGRLDVQRNSDKANLLLAHGWRLLHFTWFDLTRRVPYVVGALERELAWAA